MSYHSKITLVFSASLNICSGKSTLLPIGLVCRVGQTWARVISERENTPFKLQHLSCLPIHKRKARNSINNAKGSTVHHNKQTSVERNKTPRYQTDKAMDFKFLVVAVVLLCALSFSEAFSSNNQIGKRAKIFKVKCSPFVLCKTVLLSLSWYSSYLDHNNFDKIASTKCIQNILYIPTIYDIPPI